MILHIQIISIICVLIAFTNLSFAKHLPSSGQHFPSLQHVPSDRTFPISRIPKIRLTNGVPIVLVKYSVNRYGTLPSYATPVSNRRTDDYATCYTEYSACMPCTQLNHTAICNTTIVRLLPQLDSSPSDLTKNESCQSYFVDAVIQGEPNVFFLGATLSYGSSSEECKCDLAKLSQNASKTFTPVSYLIFETAPVISNDTAMLNFTSSNFSIYTPKTEVEDNDFYNIINSCPIDGSKTKASRRSYSVPPPLLPPPPPPPYVEHYYTPVPVPYYQPVVYYEHEKEEKSKFQKFIDKFRTKDKNSDTDRNKHHQYSSPGYGNDYGNSQEEKDKKSIFEKFKLVSKDKQKEHHQQYAPPMPGYGQPPYTDSQSYEDDSKQDGKSKLKDFFRLKGSKNKQTEHHEQYKPTVAGYGQNPYTAYEDYENDSKESGKTKLKDFFNFKKSKDKPKRPQEPYAIMGPVYGPESYGPLQNYENNQENDKTKLKDLFKFKGAKDKQKGEHHEYAPPVYGYDQRPYPSPQYYENDDSEEDGKMKLKDVFKFKGAKKPTETDMQVYPQTYAYGYNGGNNQYAFPPPPPPPPPYQRGYGYRPLNDENNDNTPMKKFKHFFDKNPKEKKHAPQVYYMPQNPNLYGYNRPGYGNPTYGEPEYGESSYYGPPIYYPLPYYGNYDSSENEEHKKDKHLKDLFKKSKKKDKDEKTEYGYSGGSYAPYGPRNAQSWSSHPPQWSSHHPEWTSQEDKPPMTPFEAISAAVAVGNLGVDAITLAASLKNQKPKMGLSITASKKPSTSPSSHDSGHHMVHSDSSSHDRGMLPLDIVLKSALKVLESSDNENAKELSQLIGFLLPAVEKALHVVDIEAANKFLASLKGTEKGKIIKAMLTGLKTVGLPAIFKTKKLKKPIVKGVAVGGAAKIVAASVAGTGLKHKPQNDHEIEISIPAEGRPAYLDQTGDKLKIQGPFIKVEYIATPPTITGSKTRPPPPKEPLPNLVPDPNMYNAAGCHTGTCPATQPQN